MKTYDDELPARIVPLDLDTIGTSPGFKKMLSREEADKYLRSTNSDVNIAHVEFKGIPVNAIRAKSSSQE